MSKIRDLVGQKFGQLIVIKQHGFTEKNKHGSRQAIWYCKCDCGNYCEMASSSLTRKRSNHSCGCLAKKHLQEMIQNNKTHGMTGRRLLGCYKGMMSRCYREKDIHYNAYGGRGIIVCDEWKNNSSAFVEWALNNGYKDDLTIDRIDVNGNYEPNNCRWIPMIEQYDNKRQNIMIEWNGEKHNAAYWSRVTGISANTIRWRYKHGWSVEKIFKEMPLPKPFEPQEGEE